ncbi:MAG: hypothetical protein ACK50M_08000 [Cyclobacteriaceae bacterium]
MALRLLALFAVMSFYFVQAQATFSPPILAPGFNQYTTAAKRNTLNTWVQWEYKRLSFLFLVVKNDRPDVLNRGTQLTSRVVDQQGVLKIAYLKQF